MWSSQRNNSYHSSISVNSSFNLKGETCPSLFMEKEVLQKKVLWYVFISLCNFAYNPRLTEFLRKWNQTTMACISEIPNPSVLTPSFPPSPLRLLFHRFVHPPSPPIFIYFSPILLSPFPTHFHSSFIFHSSPPSPCPPIFLSPFPTQLRFHPFSSIPFPHPYLYPTVFADWKSYLVAWQ